MGIRNLGYGQIQMSEDRITTTDNQFVTIIRGDISTTTLDVLDDTLKMPREHANFMFLVEGETRKVYVRGCEVNGITLFDEDEAPDPVGDIWVVE